MLPLIIFISCNQDNKEKTHSKIIERIDHQDSNDVKETFFNLVYKGYKKEGKYFLAGCSKFFGELEKEIKLNDSFYGTPDRHSSIQYTVVNLNSDSIRFKFENNLGRHSFGDSKTSIGTGFFSIKCHNEKDIIGKLTIEGMTVNKETARRHIEEGKFYILFKPENKINFCGTDYEKDDCWKNKFEKFGFENYYITKCMPIDKYYEQLEEYNNTVFNYLSEMKSFEFKDYKEMKRAFDNEVNECRNERRK